MLTTRLARAEQLLRSVDAEAILFLDLFNIRYLAGFTGSDGALVVIPSGGWFLTDSRYVTQASSQVSVFSVTEYQGKLEGVVNLLKQQGFRRVAFEPDTVSFATHAHLAAALPDCQLVPLGRDLDSLRAVKEREELELLDRTASIASAALVETLKQVRPGMPENEAALLLEWEMRRHGADKPSFDFIVASGERGALPHGVASRKTIAAGELVTFDYGAIAAGYCSDETVTVCFGEPDTRQREVYETVREAQARALAMVRSGVSCREVDAAARDHIASCGFGGYFGHGLGHGVGLEIHEKPVLSPRSEWLLEEGMVITVEPGIYIPGWGGVRIEDTVAVTADGYRSLTKVPKELIVL